MARKFKMLREKLTRFKLPRHIPRNCGSFNLMDYKETPVLLPCFDFIYPSFVNSSRMAQVLASLRFLPRSELCGNDVAATAEEGLQLALCHALGKITHLKAGTHTSHTLLPNFTNCKFNTTRSLVIEFTTYKSTILLYLRFAILDFDLSVVTFRVRVWDVEFEFSWQGVFEFEVSFKL